MELLTKCQDLYEELREATQRMDVVEAKLDLERDIDKREDLLMQEFDIAMQISGAYGDLMFELEKLEREKEGMMFFAKRMRRNANTLLQAEDKNVGKNV